MVKVHHLFMFTQRIVMKYDVDYNMQNEYLTL